MSILSVWLQGTFPVRIQSGKLQTSSGKDKMVWKTNLNNSTVSGSNSEYKNQTKYCVESHTDVILEAGSETVL